MLLSYQVAEAEEQTPGGLLLTQANKEKPSVGTVSILVSIWSIFHVLFGFLLMLIYIQFMYMLAIQHMFHSKKKKTLNF
jgi:hypothetical protein